MKLTIWSKKNKARASKRDLQAVRETHKIIDSQQTCGRRPVSTSTAIQCSIAPSALHRVPRVKSRARASTHPRSSSIGRLYQQPVSVVPEVVTRETAYDHYRLASDRQSMSDLKARQKKALEKSNFQQVRSKTAQPPARLASSTISESSETAGTDTDLQVVKSKRRVMTSPNTRGSSSSARPTINVINAEDSDDSPVHTGIMRRSSHRAGKFSELIDPNSTGSPMASASTTPQGSPTGSTMAVISHSRHSDPVKRDSLDLTHDKPTPKTPPGLGTADGSSTPRQTNSNARRSERLRPSPPTLHRSPGSRTQSSEELLQQMVELTMQPHTDRQYASHGVIAGPRSQKGKEKLTALPDYDPNKPPAVLSPTRQDNQRTITPTIRSVHVNPPLYNPLANRCFQWVSESRQTSRPIQAWAVAKRWICCECQSATIVEQQICSRLCCQHARCQLACRLAQYAETM